MSEARCGLMRRARVAGDRPRRHAGIIACGALLLAALPLTGSAQERAPRDSTRRPRPTTPDSGTLDTLSIDSPRRDGRQAAADSAARDSTIARQLRETARTRAVTRLGPLVDRLRLTAVGASGGSAWPRRVSPSSLMAVQADYGSLVPGFDLVFTVSYWQSTYSEGARRGFANALAQFAGAEVPLPAIRSSVFTFGVDGRWRPALLTGIRGPASRIRPFASGGLAVHFPNAEGAPITGTFVEQQLDGVALGLAGGVGTDLVLLPNFQLTMLARYDVFNGAHFASLRAGASYLFEPWRRPVVRAGRVAPGGA